MQQLNQRQQKILEYLSQSGPLNNSALIALLGNQVSRFTVLRDLDLLLKEDLIKKEGKGRSVRYRSSGSIINLFFDPDEYFKRGPDERKTKTELDGNIIDNWDALFFPKEINRLETANAKYLKKIRNIDKAFFKKEIERLIIELSWKSSHIEGNTYSLIDTELLIKERIEASGHNKEEAIMILNHKNAIDYIFKNKNEFQKIDLFQIEKVHELLTRGLRVKNGIRTGPIRVTGTKYMPPEGRAKITSILHKAIDKVNSLNSPFLKAIVLILMISYIQPFEDGNKRTSRILGNAILLANNTCPLSYRSINEGDYKKAILLFYEQNSARFFKELFIEQFEFAAENYF